MGTIRINCLPFVVATSPAVMQVELVTVLALRGANCFCSFSPKPSSLCVLTMTILFYPFRVSRCDDSMSATCHFQFKNHWIVLFQPLNTSGYNPGFAGIFNSCSRDASLLASLEIATTRALLRLVWCGIVGQLNACSLSKSNPVQYRMIQQQDWNVS